MRVAWIALVVVACGKPPEAPVAAREPAPPQSAAPTDDAAPLRWQVRELLVEGQCAPDQLLAGFDGPQLQNWAAPALTELPMVRGVGMAAGVTRSELVGVAVTVTWQRMDAAWALVPMDAPTAVSLVLQFQVQAETPGRRPTEPEIARRKSQVVLPMPPGADVAWLQPRMQRALGQAVADVLAELWVRRATDDDLARWMQDGDTWQVAACAREAGERGLQAQRKRLQKLAKDTREQVAVVAVTALGRLGGDDSIAVLAKAAAASHRETALAALDALAMLRSAAAMAKLCALAQELQTPPLQRHAEQLCDAPTATGGAPQN